MFSASRRLPKGNSCYQRDVSLQLEGLVHDPCLIAFRFKQFTSLCLCVILNKSACGLCFHLPQKTRSLNTVAK